MNTNLKKIHINNKNKLSETDYKIQMTKDQILYVDKIGEMVLKNSIRSRMNKKFF